MPPSHNDIILQIPREGALSLRQKINGVGGQYTEVTESVGPSIPIFFVREVAEYKTSRILYKAVVQVVLMFRLETWS